MDQPVNHLIIIFGGTDCLHIVLAMQNAMSHTFVPISRKITNLYSLPYVTLSVLKLCQNPWSREDVEWTWNENG